MKKHIGAISLLVRDYDEALFYYVDQLGFRLLEDTDMGRRQGRPPNTRFREVLILVK
ncbi:MAG: VOC family protein [Anaerolineales bacterium]|nr:VOC family protein [Anaerolineales bacterium]